MPAALLGAEGKPQREAGVTHIIVTRLFNLSGLMGKTRLTPAQEPSLFTGVSEPAGDAMAEKEAVGLKSPAARNFK